jgi:hypothetical protein
MKPSVLVVALAILCGGVRAVSATTINTGPVVMTTTGGANSITVDVEIADNGAVPGCTFFLILRDGSMAAYFPRQPGVQNTLTFIDTNVAPNRTYWYELTVSILPIPIPTPACDPIQFRQAFGSTWGAPIDVPGHVGTDPVPVAHGKLVAEEFNPPYAHLELCGGSPAWWYLILTGYEAYLGQDVMVYGEYQNWNVQFGWDFQLTSMELLPCAPLATQNATWGRVKSMYR